MSATIVTIEAISEPILGTGTVGAHKTTILGPRVNGIIDEIYVGVGDRVDAGAPLFRTRPTNYEIRVKEAGSTARLARAEAEKAKRDLERVETLHAQDVASNEQLDGARTGFEIAAARRDQASAALAHARQELKDTTVHAPYPGVITHRYVDEGAMMSTMMSSSARVLELMKVDLVVAVLQIPEIHLRRVAVGTKALVSIDGTGGEYESEVHVLNDLVDPVSRAFEVRLGIRNPDLAIKPGLFAEAQLLPEPRQVAAIDRTAVLGAGDDRHVFVESGGHAKRRRVQVRDLDALRLEVVDGLAEGERVLIGPDLSRLADGTPVSVELAHAHR
jgi:RND family efflux transporter MFP subunit